MKKVNMIFIAFCLTVLLIPSAGMIAAPTMETTENKVLSEIPKIKEDGKLNVEYLSRMGEYFTEHFAFRQQMVSANAAIYGRIFKTSVTDKVLLGQNGWMYYTETLDDYTARRLMTERALKNVVHNLKLMQEYIESRGSKFILVIAPNKNSLYSDNMPYNYQKRTEKNNYERLKPLFDSAGIHYVDLFSAFRESGEVLYFKKDTHWNNKGAVLAYNEIMKNMDLDYETYEHIPFEVKKDHMGDLTEMLYPLNSTLEENQYYHKEWLYSYHNEVTDHMDNWIETSSPKSDECLLMYRDSFGESMLPFFAEEFGTAYFSRLVPYNLMNIETCRPDYTVIERVERRLSSFAERAAVMPTPEVRDIPKGGVKADASVHVKTDGDYYVVSGLLKERPGDTNTKIYVKAGERIFEAFHISAETKEGINDYGYMLYLKKDMMPSEDTSIEVFISE